ncbi:hypothetical protein O7635_24375 [Asanoa sp. WMMD1127]|uniref:hypothetical protein n=1 Tax=Asanoa sp. WMMD1127 TaxID=3016107 RepID=UPI0024180E09|nr:hypothetical protein [Asanoa sp. WMMD1127]MDG4824997.1 hypothetical protein [Asanoa sp. WMMD1127]
MGDMSLRAPSRASLLLKVVTTDGELLVLQDSATGLFARPSVLQPDRDMQVLALSADGAQVVLSAYTSDGTRVGLHDLATGRERWADLPYSGWVPNGGAAVDGDTAVVLAYTDDESKSDDPDATVVMISLVHVDSGRSEVLYSTPGGFRAESTIALSPDRTHLAASIDTPLSADNGPESHTVIVNLGGAVIRDIVRSEMVPPGNTGWLSETNLACVRYDENDVMEAHLANVDVFSGRRQPLRSSARRPIARLDDRFLFQVGAQQGDLATRLESAALEGDDWRPFLAFDRPGFIAHADVATSDV